MKGHKCPCAKRHKCPPFGPLAGYVPAAPHATRGMVGIFFLSLSSGKLHWQFPDSSTEDKFLSVLKNNVSDTRGTELLLQEISLGFSSGFPIEQFPQKFQNSFSSTPPIVRYFPMTQERKRLTKTTLRTFASTCVSSGRRSDSSGRKLDSSGFQIPQEFASASSGKTPVSSMFLNILGVDNGG